MLKLSSKKAFSLIELSIVILIIGIIIAGVTQGSRLVRQFKLSSAKTLTSSAPVASVKGLSLWLETTLDTSIPDAQTEEGVAVQQWNDINPQSLTKYFAVNTDDETSPVYSESAGVNGLPSISFPDRDRILSLTKDIAGTLPAAFTTQDNAFTFFIVSVTPRVVADGESYSYLDNGDDVSRQTAWRYMEAPAHYALAGAWHNSEATTIDAAPRIIVGSFNGTTLKGYFNGVIDHEDSGTAVIPPASGGSLVIGQMPGQTAGFQGFISEIIVFDRALKNEERHSIEDYLGKKYNIKVTHVDNLAP